MIIRMEGADIQAWCGKSLEVGNHIIQIMKGNRISKVKCQMGTCIDEHVYRKQQPKRRKNSATQEMIDSNDYIKRLAEANVEESVAYLLSGAFEKNQVITHPTFGLGFVRKLMPGSKMEVLFEKGAKNTAIEDARSCVILTSKSPSAVAHSTTKRTNNTAHSVYVYYVCAFSMFCVSQTKTTTQLRQKPRQSIHR